MLLKDVDALVSVNDGKLEAQARASGGYGGSLDGSASVAPSSGATVALKVNLKLQDLRAGLASGDEVAPAEVPPTSLLADITASGATPRQMASSANGSLLFSLGPGRTGTGALTMVGTGVIGQLFGKLNPFAKEDKFTVVDCSVIRGDMKNGKTTLEPILFQTGKVTVTAHGSIDLGTEALALDFNTRPREGIGISPGMFTNPFLELRGTLANPTVGVGAKGVTSGALAAATGGVTVIAKGAVDRLKGEVDLCGPTLQAAQHPAQEIGSITPGRVRFHARTRGSFPVFVASLTMNPSTSSMVRSHESDSRGSWVTTSTAQPDSALKRRNKSNTPAAAFVSRFPVGSSASSSAGRVIRARAIATRCCWPPESSPGFLSTYCSISMARSNSRAAQ